MSSEFELLARLLPLLGSEDLVLPPGDDAAVVMLGAERAVLTVDAVVGGIHAKLDWSTPEDVGWRALAVNVSDLAAVGARPVAAVAALVRPADLSDETALGLYRGMRAAADRWDVKLAGGDISSGPGLVLAVTAIGTLVGDAPLTRSGARPGDHVVLIGQVGLAATFLALRRAAEGGFLRRHPELGRAYHRPEALPHAGAALVRAAAHAAIDVSDGLGQDCGHVATASHVRIVLDADRLPVAPAVVAAAERLEADPLRAVVGGGDDYALVATLDPDAVPGLARELAATDTPVRTIGAVEEGAGVVLIRPDGGEEDVSRWGWEHGRPGEDT